MTDGNESQAGGATALRPMTAADHGLVDSIFAEAFARNDLAKLLLGEGDIRSRIIRLNRRIVRGKRQDGTIAEVGGVPAGAMVEGKSPHCEPSGLQGLLFAFDALLASRSRIFKASGFSGEITKNHPKWPHRHLTILGVKPEFQGTGVGSTLLKKFCDDADAAGENSYLETDSEAAKRLYERFGFVEVNRIKLEDVDFIFMWREAKKAD